MSKKKNRLKAKNVRQGRTIYIVDSGFECIPPKPSVRSIRISSDSTPLPPEGCIIEHAPAWFVKQKIEHMQGMAYFSRRKAQRVVEDKKREYSYTFKNNDF